MSKNIVYVTSAFPFGKSETWAFNEINSLHKLGAQVTIIPKNGKGKIINKDALKLSSNLVDLPFLNWSIFIFLIKTLLSNPVLFLKIFSEIIEQSNSLIDFCKAISVLPKAFFLAEILKNKKVDHIHSLSTTTTTAVIAYIISLKLKVPWSYTLHSSSIINERYKRSFIFRSRSALKCRTISQIIADDLSNFIGPSLSKKVCMVHLGVDIQDLKKKSNTMNNPFIIATPAELKVHKGHIYAIDAAKILIDKGITNFKWLFYGDGPLLNDLQKKVKELNLTDYCYFPGNLDHQNLLDKYKNNEVDIVVSSSISILDVFEGIPVSLMEAMSYQIPVIASDCGGTKELVDGQSGILVNQKDSAAIANAIIELKENSVYRTKMSVNARNKIEQDFDTIKNANDLIKLF